MPMLVLIHSPLVGPLTWKPVAARVRTLGHPAVVPSLAGVVDDAGPYYRKLARRVSDVVRQARPEGPVVLVGHSGAGGLLPVVGEAVGDVDAAVFVDAILPHPGRSWFDTAPPEVREQLRALAVGQRLPPWHRWFPAEAVAALLPDENIRARFVSELPEVPVAYFEESAPAVGRWTPGACGYVQLSEAYEREAGEAERRGWLTVREPMDHLAPLTRPDEVAALLGRLIEAMVRTRP